MRACNVAHSIFQQQHSVADLPSHDGLQRCIHQLRMRSEARTHLAHLTLHPRVVRAELASGEAVGLHGTQHLGRGRTVDVGPEEQPSRLLLARGHRDPGHRLR